MNDADRAAQAFTDALDPASFPETVLFSSAWGAVWDANFRLATPDLGSMSPLLGAWVFPDGSAGRFTIGARHGQAAFTEVKRATD